jgi:HlyD family secretion protein
MPRSTCVLSLSIVIMTCVFSLIFAHGDEPPRAGIPVKAIKVGHPEKNIITGMGSVSCSNAVDLGFDSTGVISEVLVKEGERVEEGQPLVKLDQRIVDCEIAVENAAATAAEAEYNLQSAEYLKKEELFKKEALSESELNRAVFEKERAARKSRAQRERSNPRKQRRPA